MLNEVQFSKDLSYSSDGENKPVRFYLECLKNSSRFDLRLGYFSSSAIQVLSLGFAKFIHSGGKVRIITNHYLSEKDKKELLVETDKYDYDYSYIESKITQDVVELESILSSREQHFFDCLKYLLNNGQLVLKPVKIKPGKLSHYKEGIFSDGENQVYFNGSCNFTYSGLIENGESLGIKRSWGSPEEQLKITNETEKLNNIFAEKDKNHEYLTADQIEGVIQQKGLSKDLEGLVREEHQLYQASNGSKDNLNELLKKERESFKSWIKKELNIPIFPHEKPYDYQIEAYKKWIENDKKGIFAMATGTGKTITALNCLLNEYRDNPNNIYQAIVLVPTITLVEQWEEEALEFNFKKILKISSRNNWRKRLATLLTTAQRIPTSFFLISTYATFTSEQFQTYIKKLPDQTLFIADEAHNMGASSVLKVLDNIPSQKRIGLSATPKRIYDPEGTEKIEDFFSDKEPYTFPYSMDKAIKNDRLCRYEYYPHIVELTPEELGKYVKLSKKIAKQYFIESDIDKNSNLQRLLLARKRIVHKASNKLDKAVEILKNRYAKEGDLKYTFVYAPEGSDPEIDEEYLENEEEAKLINQYMMAIAKIDDSIMVNKVVGGMNNRDQILNQFSNGDIHVLASMKCLDEGVNIPRTEYAIFCSSTGNPRQFIQRRGRILRTHGDKTSATIHDLVVTPLLNERDSETFQTEKKLVENELERVMYFASLSRNPSYSFDKFERVCNHYDINIYSIYNNLKDD